jgi:hypothetical protein
VSMNALICGAILDGHYPDTILGGRTMSHRGLWWHLAASPRALLATRIPTWIVSG